MALSPREQQKLAQTAARYAQRKRDCAASMRTITTKLAGDPTSARAAQWKQRLEELAAQIAEYDAHLGVLAARGVTLPKDGDHDISPPAAQMGATGAQAG